MHGTVTKESNTHNNLFSYCVMDIEGVIRLIKYAELE